VFLVAVLSFVSGIYIQAIHPFSLKALIIPLVISICITPFFIHKKYRIAPLILCISFMFVGMVRIGMVQTKQAPIVPDDAMTIYEGLVTETTANTVILKISKPENLHGAGAIFRTQGSLNIDDRIRIFGEAKEIIPSFKNPYTITWKWLKRLEGIPYEIRGTLLSASPGNNPIHALRDRLKKRVDYSGASYPGIIKALTIGDTTGLDENTKALFRKK